MFSVKSSKSLFLLVIVVLIFGICGQGQECIPTFELLTGFVYSASEDTLDTFQDVFKLAECLQKCANNSKCQSINFETGLCITLGSRADQKPEALAESQFPVYTLHAQKTCLRGFDKCNRDWAFEKVPKHQLVGFTRKTRTVGSKEACAEECLKEDDFVCRSFNYDNNLGSCSLSDMDRHSVSDSRSFRSASGNGDYYESNCAKDPVSLCEFREVPGKVLKTVDAVYTGVDTRDECRKLCLASNFRCHSYDHGDSGHKVCRLSHHSAASLVNTKGPYLELEDSTTFEMDACYNVQVECGATGMTAIIETSKIFNGKMYPKSQPRSCVVDVVNSLKFRFRMEYNDLDCDVKQVGYGQYANDIVIQHHNKIVTNKDLGVSVKCQYDLNNKTVSNGFDVGGHVPAGGTESATVRSPSVTMRITNSDGSKIDTAKVGDHLSIRFEVDDPTSPYQIFVRELIAVDGVDSNEIMLIDRTGCPTEPLIMSHMVQENSQGKVLTAAFNAFKFPSTDIVQFKALVTPCLPSCEPVKCETSDRTGISAQVDSYGRRKKRDIIGHSKKTSQNQDDVVVIESLRVSDKFGFHRSSRNSDTLSSENGNENGSLVVEESNVCLNIMGLIIACTLFLVAQLILIIAWAYMWKKRRNNKLDSPISQSPTQDDIDSIINNSMRHQRRQRGMLSQLSPYQLQDDERHLHHGHRSSSSLSSTGYR